MLTPVTVLSFTKPAISDKVLTLVFLKRCLMRPKHQSRVNLVWPVIKQCQHRSVRGLVLEMWGSNFLHRFLKDFKYLWIIKK